jgi:general stress protein YciG
MIDEETHKYLSEIGRKGGLKQGAINKKKGKEYFSMMGKKGAEARRLKKLSTEKTIDLS